MSTPRIPGRTTPSAPRSLAETWQAPPGEWPVSELWPIEYLRRVEREPAGWLVVEENFFRDEAHGGTACVLVPSTVDSLAVQSTGWIGRDLGNFGVWDDGKVDDGLTAQDGELLSEFFLQVRRPSGAQGRHVEVALPFLWFWDAFPVADGWRYVNAAGREQDLIRWDLSRDASRVEVRALEFRKFLHATGRSALVQLDYVLKAQTEGFERVDSSVDLDGVHFTFHALSDRLMGERPEYSRLLGQYVVAPLAGVRVPRWEEYSAKVDYPEFIVGLDPSTGTPVRHTCDPDLLGTYFDGDESNLHYLTPVNFNADVLQPYQAEPSRYAVSTTRLDCLDLWGLSISINSSGRVEAYLGDLGRDLPADEWGRWLAHNVAPEGEMEMGRFRRDFLGQFASSPDPNRDLRTALTSANAAAQTSLGSALWREPDEVLEREFQSLIGPLSDDPNAMTHPVLVLAKVLVDGLDTRLLRSLATEDHGGASLQMLRDLLTARGDDADASEALRALQAIRSRGGVAHVTNSGSSATFEAVGIAGMRPRDAFTELVRQIVASLGSIERILLSQA